MATKMSQAHLVINLETREDLGVDNGPWVGGFQGQEGKSGWDFECIELQVCSFCYAQGRMCTAEGPRSMKLALAGHGFCLLQARPVRRLLMPRLWLPKPVTRPPMCSLSFRVCRRMWSGGRASLGVFEART